MGGDKEVGVRGMGEGVVEILKLRKTMMLGSSGIEATICGHG